MANGPGVITLEGCIPNGAIDIWNAQQGQTILRPWTFSVNGQVSMPQILDNGSVVPNGYLDARNVAMGFDGTLIATSGDYAGTELLQISGFNITVSPGLVPLQPLKALRVQRRIVSVDITLTFTEFVINDNIILAQVLLPLLPISPFLVDPNSGQPVPYIDPQLSFQGQLVPALVA